MYIITLFLVFTCAIPVHIFSQSNEDPPQQKQALWIMETHHIRNSIFADKMNNFFAQGYAFGGLEAVGKDDIQVIYYFSPENIPYNWALYEFSDLGQLEKEMTELLTQGWIPRDITRTEDSLFGFFEKEDREIKRWRLQVSTSSEQLEHNIGVYRVIGYQLHGLSIDESQAFWALFVLSEDSSQSGSLRGYRSEDISDALTATLLNAQKPSLFATEGEQSYLVILPR